jgi:serine O-acetyltransferase
MSGDLTQDFDAHVPFSFVSIPDSPFWANRSARVRRWFFVAFAESWLAVFLFRVKKRLRIAHVPFLPGLCDMLSRALFRISIGNAVEVGAGLMMTHGNVVIDGRTRIGKHCQINPWVTIGLSNSKKLGFSADGPTIGDEVHIGTGAKILGPVMVGDHARIGANAVVIHDVPANTTVVGAPARVVLSASSAGRGPGGNGAVSDEALVAAMRQAIVDFKLKRRSLTSLVETLTASFDSGSDQLKSAGQEANKQIALLDLAASTGRGGAADVELALARLEASL